MMFVRLLKETAWLSKSITPFCSSNDGPNFTFVVTEKAKFVTLRSVLVHAIFLSQYFMEVPALRKPAMLSKQICMQQFALKTITQMT